MHTIRLRNSREQSPLENWTVSQLVTKFPEFRDAGSSLLCSQKPSSHFVIHTPDSCGHCEDSFLWRCGDAVTGCLKLCTSKGFEGFIIFTTTTTTTITTTTTTTINTTTTTTTTTTTIMYLVTGLLFLVLLFLN